MRLTGYSDRLSAGPGETVAFQVSSAHPSYEADIVRLIHGDPNPLGPGLLVEAIATPVSGTYPGRVQELFPGSFIEAPFHPAPADLRSFTVQAWIQPTTPHKERQGLLACWAEEAAAGFALELNRGSLTLRLGAGESETATISVPASLDAHRWHSVAAAFDAESGEAHLVQEPLPVWPIDAARADVSVQTELDAIAVPEMPLIIGALRDDATGRTFAHFNGKIDRPALFSRALSAMELRALREGASALSFGAAVIAAWDFSREMDSDRAIDISPQAMHGRVVNLPGRAMTGANWSGDECSARHAPHEYGAIHFHDDDLDDAGWETDFTFTVPEALPSGVYAARIRAGSDIDHLPFVVRPPRGTANAAIAYLIPTFTYLAYANEHVPIDPPSLFPFADLGAHSEQYQYIADNHLHSLYDTHSDGPGVCYASWKRPLVNVRPDHVFRIYSSPERLGVDLYLTHWMEEKGFACDAIADENLHHEGAALLAPYRVVVTGSHPEYWTQPMLEALDQYLDGGGRIMYLGGNGFYWVTGVDPHRPHVIEIRRWRGTETWEAQPGEAFLSTTGEQGGLWRNRNRAPQKRLGVGFTSQGNDYSRPYRRLPASRDPRAAFIFAGVDEEMIGDFPSLMLRHGAAGYEIDRADFALGTPPHALVLATASGFSDSYQHVVEEVLSTDGERGGTASELVRADVVYFEGPQGGAVFSVGSIAWCGALSNNDGDNSVSRITENVLRRSASDHPLPEPHDG